MKNLYFLAVFASWNPLVLAAGVSTKTEIVEELEKTEVKIFCSKSSEKEAAASCQKWLDSQTKTLGPRLLLSYCSDGELQTTNSACLYKATGELHYVLKKSKTDTEKSL